MMIVGSNARVLPIAAGADRGGASDALAAPSDGASGTLSLRAPVPWVGAIGTFVENDLARRMYASSLLLGEDRSVEPSFATSVVRTRRRGSRTVESWVSRLVVTMRPSRTSWQRRRCCVIWVWLLRLPITVQRYSTRATRTAFLRGTVSAVRVWCVDQMMSITMS